MTTAAAESKRNLFTFVEWRQTVNVMATVIARHAGYARRPARLGNLYIRGFHPFDAEGGDRHGAWVWPWVKQEVEPNLQLFASFALTIPYQNDRGGGNDRLGCLAAFEGFIQSDQGEPVDLPTRTDYQRIASVSRAAADAWPQLLLETLDRLDQAAQGFIETINPAAGTSLPSHRLVFENGRVLDFDTGEVRAGQNYLGRATRSALMILRKLAATQGAWVSSRIAGPYTRQGVYTLRRLIEDNPHYPHFISSRRGLGYKLEGARWSR